MTHVGEPFLIGIDLGTQSVRALLVDLKGRTLACARRPTPTRHIAEGQAEYDPDALWAAVLDLLRELALVVPAGGTVAGIACASIGESCVLVDADGEPLAPAIAWFDRRTDAIAPEIEQRVGAERLFRITGLSADPTLSLCKLLWYRRARPAAFARARRVLLMSPWIAFRLSGVPAIDPSLASRTLCLDVHARAWSGEVLAAMGIAPALLPPVLPSGTALGPVRPEVLAATGLPGQPVVAVGGHDHVCGGFAVGAARAGVLLDSIGTSEALFLTVNGPALRETDRAAGFMQGAVGLHRAFCYVGAGINRCGGAIDWARGLLGNGLTREQMIAEAAAVPPGSRGICFLPHLAYSPPPHPDPAGRGAFVGLTEASDRATLFRAVIEGLAMEARVVTDALAALPAVGAPEDLRVIGGGTKNALLLQIKASAYGRPLTVIDEPEATALGAALLGGIAAGIWPNLDVALDGLEQKRHRVEPIDAWTAYYAQLFEAVYCRLYRALGPINHRLASLASFPS